MEIVKGLAAQVDGETWSVGPNVYWHPSGLCVFIVVAWLCVSAWLIVKQWRGC